MPRKKISDFDILKLIGNGLNASEIAFKYGLSKGAISQRIKKLQERGLIELDVEKTAFQQSLTLKHVKYYRLTERGKVEVSKMLRGGEVGVQLPRLRGVHNVQFKFKIKKKGDLWFDHSVVLKNWVKKYTWFGDIYVEQNGKDDNPSTLVIKFSLEENDPWKAAFKALETALRMKKIFEDMVGFELGDPVMIGKPKWEVLDDPVAKEISQKQVIVTEYGAIDNTPEPGTLHFYDPDDVETYLRMPGEIREIKQEVKETKEEIRKVPEIVAEMVRSMAVEIGKEIVQAVLHPTTKDFSQDRIAQDEKTVVEGYA